MCNSGPITFSRFVARSITHHTRFSNTFPPVLLGDIQNRSASLTGRASQIPAEVQSRRPTMSKQYQPSAEQLAMAEERRLKKAQRKAALAKEEEEKGRILQREWIELSATALLHYPSSYLPRDYSFSHNVSSVSLTISDAALAARVRPNRCTGRELFPTSDCMMLIYVVSRYDQPDTLKLRRIY